MDQAIRLAPESPLLYLERGRIHEKADEEALAKADFTKADQLSSQQR